MGAGASTKELTAEQQAKVAEMAALTPEAKQEMAAAAMKGLLMLGATRAVEAGKKPQTWSLENEELGIPVPMIGSFEKVAETVAKVPMVGKSLAEAVMKPVGAISESFIECAVAVCNEPGTLAALTESIAAIDTATSVEVSERGADAYTGFLMSTTEEKLWIALHPLVEEVLKTAKITKVWGDAIGSYNSAVTKVKMDPMEFDLPSYVVEQVLATIEAIIKSTERDARAGKTETASSNVANYPFPESVTKVFAGGLPTPEQMVKGLILVKVGDPRALVFPKESIPQSADQRYKEVVMATGPDGSLALVAGGPAPQLAGPWSYCMVGVGAKAGAESGMGSNIIFSRDDQLLVTTWSDGQQRCLDVSHWRYAENQPICIVCDPANKKNTFRRNGGRDFMFNEDGTCSPCKGKKFVLGVNI